MISALVLAAVLTIVDPSGDALGDGSLSYPTAEVFRVPDTLDARELSVSGGETFAFSLTMAQITNPWELEHGFSLPIIELYVNTREAGGSAELLPGSGMRLPQGVLWNYAFRISGESVELLYADPVTGTVRDVTQRYDVRLELIDTTLVVTTALPRPRHFSLYGVLGGYDPWDPSRWRRVAPAAEPFAFGSPSQAATGIRAVDVLTETPEQQLAAIQSGVLPEIRAPERQGRWLFVIAAGLVIALLGSLSRLYLEYKSKYQRPQPGPIPSRPSIGFGSQFFQEGKPPRRSPSATASSLQPATVQRATAQTGVSRVLTALKHALPLSRRGSAPRASQPEAEPGKHDPEAALQGEKKPELTANE